MNARDVFPRLAEIRQENVGGDVSFTDIAWLCDLAEAAARQELAALAASEVGAGHAAEEDVAASVVGEGEAVSAAVGDGVVAGGLDDLADHDVVGAVEASDGDFNPVADVELHYPIVTADAAGSYADDSIRCGICGNCWGCDCSANGNDAA